MAKLSESEVNGMAEEAQAFIAQKAGELRRAGLESHADEKRLVLRAVRVGGMARLAVLVAQDFIGWANNPMRRPRPTVPELLFATRLDVAGTAMRRLIFSRAISGHTSDVAITGPDRGQFVRIDPLDRLPYPEGYSLGPSVTPPPFIRVVSGSKVQPAFIEVSLWTPPSTHIANPGRPRQIER